MKEYNYIEKPTKKEKKPYKLKQKGKVGNEWDRTKRAWYAVNKPNYKDCYICHWCGNEVHKSEVDLDHVVKKGSHPNLRADLTNLAPIHRNCHIAKDSGMR